MEDFIYDEIPAGGVRDQFESAIRGRGAFRRFRNLVELLLKERSMDLKNQYFGDVGDYGKYGLLRFLAKNGINIAINWYLTPNAGSNDGKHISYLNDGKMRRFDPELFDLLSEMLNNGIRDINAFEDQDKIPGAIYYNKLLDNTGITRSEKRDIRTEWHKDALDICKEADLVFLDPDNGACEKEPTSAKESIKYCYASEIADYYNAGQNVVYYCSKGRRTYDQWEDTKAMMQRVLPDAKLAIITFHKGTQRSYIFVLHKKSFRKYVGLIREFLRKWPRIFTEEFGKTGNLDGGKTGVQFCVTNSKGVELTIEECADGWVNIQFSDNKNSYSRISIDHLFSKLR